MLHEKEGDTDEKSSHGMDGLERFGGRTVRTSPLRSPPFNFFLFSQFTMACYHTLASSQEAAGDANSRMVRRRRRQQEALEKERE